MPKSSLYIVKSDRTPELLLTVGVLYVGAIVFRDHILALVGVPTEVTVAYLRALGAVHVAANLALQLPALGLLVFLWFRYKDGWLRASLRSETASALTGMAMATLGVSFALNLLALWPFMWRWASESTSAYVGVLLSSRQWLAIALWIASLGVVTPVIEELVFRVGILQTVRSQSGSKLLAVFVSSAAFSVTHLGYLPPNRAHLVNATWLFAASWLLGTITLRRQGRIMLSITAHATRNLLEALVVVLVAARGPT